MNFLAHISPFVFFTGKGGVGKTSLACATAIQLAKQGKHTLLVSTDPASNVGQVFEQTIGTTIKPIQAVPNLSAIELDPQAAAEQYRKRIVDPVKGILPDEVVVGIEEQLSGACTTEIAAFDEFTGLLTNQALLAQFDHIVFDTAPTGHTIRMLQLPGAWSEFISDNPEGSSCLGPLAGLEKQKAQYQNAVDALADAKQTRLVLVARAQKTALLEVARTYEELAALGIHNQYLVVNGVLGKQEATNDILASAIYAREQQAIEQMPSQLTKLPTDYLPLKPFNLVGVKALSQLFDSSLTSQSRMAEYNNQLPDVASLAQLLKELETQQHGLIMLMGKGGVGKTTLASAIAVHLAQKGLDVHLSTSDPAAHLSNTLDKQLPNLAVSRIDPKVETERYRQHVLETTGKDMSEQDRLVLEEDLRSPCTEEIAVFQAFSRTIREAGKKIVVMDTAPTGHTLLLLDATGAYHKEVTRQMAKSQTHFTTPMMRLQDPDYTKVIITTLAETTPVLEAAHLQDDLRRAGIEPWAWIINNSVAASETSSELLQLRAQSEIPQIQKVLTEYAKRTAIVPLQAEEPIGINALTKLAN
ncbi:MULTISPECIES: arsenical pump-driving ATPase [unclassified Gilliamella]|uniref:arsenical pump-driving ATPase n=1 Tax=unclassified Gilliamella TaxID=2685620 RepID=UPI002269A1C2|nr:MULTISPECIES: arsenical pump-driving ATPase [unclassified Gilliamella]MCX8588520.1 arsenical pump-driving ATPase [Gilliamella sp. B3801]MCX8592958.1 arsenical pump-driving ATPase [Gilliamella sp. B3804]